MYSERQVAAKQADGEATEKRLQEHCQRFVWVLAEDHHPCVEQTECNAAQNAQNHAVHSKPRTFRVRSLALYAQLLYLFAVERKLDTRRAAVIAAFPISLYGDHIFYLFNFLHGHQPVSSDKFAVAPASDGIVAHEAPSRINYHAALREESEEGLYVVMVDCLNETVNRREKCGAGHRPKSSGFLVDS
jgi:hypothetical protein